MGTLKLIICRTFDSRLVELYSSIADDVVDRCAIAYINPSDAETLGVKDNDTIAVSIGDREVIVKAKVSDKVLKGSIVMPLCIWSMILISSIDEFDVFVKVRKVSHTPKPHSPRELLDIISLVPP